MKPFLLLLISVTLAFAGEPKPPQGNAPMRLLWELPLPVTYNQNGSPVIWGIDNDSPYPIFGASGRSAWIFTHGDERRLLWIDRLGQILADIDAGSFLLSSITLNSVYLRASNGGDASIQIRKIQRTGTAISQSTLTVSNTDTEYNFLAAVNGGDGGSVSGFYFVKIGNSGIVSIKHYAP